MDLECFLKDEAENLMSFGGVFESAGAKKEIGSSITSGGVAVFY